MKDPNYSVCKVFCHSDKIADYLKKDVKGPISIELHPTNRCNMNCLWCEPHLLGRINKKQEMSQKRLISLADELYLADVRGILISGGGEPLLHPNICEFIDKCTNHKISVGLFTNGSLISEKNMESLLKCDFVRVSFDAGFKSTYNKIKRCKSYDKVVKNIKNLVELREKLESKTTIGTSYVISHDTKSENEILKYIFLMAKLNVDYIQFRPVRSDNLIPIEELIKIKNLIENTKIILNIPTNIIYNPHYNTAYTDIKRTYKKCHMTNFQVVIAPNGDMYPCYGFIHRQDKCMGNIGDNFKKNWKKRKININCREECVECRFHLQNKMLEDLKTITHRNFM